MLKGARVASSGFLFRTSWRTNISNKKNFLPQCKVMLKNCIWQLDYMEYTELHYIYCYSCTTGPTISKFTCHPDILSIPHLVLIR